MFDDEAVERVVRYLRRSVRIDPALDHRVMEEIAALPAGPAAPAGRVWRWMTGRRLTLSPLGAFGLAAAFVVAVVGVWRIRAAPDTVAPALRGFQFVLVEPHAANVSLVGDFNDWDATRTPMHRTPGDGLWSAVVPLEPGRYRYAFLIDGRLWVADPTAPTTRDDDFGAPSSVLTVEGL